MYREYFICWYLLDKMSGLIWIQTVLHSDGIPERLILKKKISRGQERMQNYAVGKEFNN